MKYFIIIYIVILFAGKANAFNLITSPLSPINPVNQANRSIINNTFNKNSNNKFYMGEKLEITKNILYTKKYCNFCKKNHIFLWKKDTNSHWCKLDEYTENEYNNGKRK